MAVLWLQGHSIYYQFCGGVTAVSWTGIALVISAMIWPLGSTVLSSLASSVKTALSNRLMKINKHHWIISFHIQQGIPSSFYLYLVQTKCLKGTFEDCVERLEARQRTNRTSGMRIVVSSTDLLYPAKELVSALTLPWAFSTLQNAETVFPCSHLEAQHAVAEFS